MRRRTKLPNPHTLTPDFMSKSREAKLRTHKIFVRLNDEELRALRKYQDLVKGSTRSKICREIIMEKVIRTLDENQPTLF